MTYRDMIQNASKWRKATDSITANICEDMDRLKSLDLPADQMEIIAQLLDDVREKAEIIGRLDLVQSLTGKRI